MFSLIAFLLTFIEIAAAAAGYFLQSTVLFSNIVVYGSPFYLAMNLLKEGAMVSDKTWLYMGFLAFHVIKYVSIFRAQFSEERNILRTMALIFEAAYLIMSAYYLL